MSAGMAGQLAAKICATVFEDFSDATVHKAKLHILDTLGVALAGSASSETRMTMAALGLGEGQGRAAIWGSCVRTDARTAAFVNGVSAHAFELDDSGGCDHSGAVVLPAALAVLGEMARPVSGRNLLRSVLIGYEVGRRVLEAAGGYEVHNDLGWHSTGTCGPFAAAAAAGMLLEFDAPKMASALGTACSYAGGNWAFIRNGSPAKKLHPGRAAEGGVIAAHLAAQGFEGPDAVFQPAVWGSFFATFCAGKADASALVSEFGQNWRMNRCSIKPYATCRGTHAAIDAIDLIFTRHGLNASDVASVEADMSRFQFGMCGGTVIQSRAQAQMSLPYALAARLRYGKVFLAELETKAWSDPGIADWLDRISVRVDTAMKDEDEPSIAIVTKDGQRHHATVEFPLGGPLNPLSDAQVIAKYSDLAGAVLPATRVAAIRDIVLDLDGYGDARQLLPLLQKPG
ncbi:MmgE/PrpD family protein [Mesorhizobium sp. M0659]|uniref:MmgE/PrpD family protein n=1 Tax=Mesorhizobium sp. M0659 TaxID=2956980 RepID=UPI00333A68B7